MANLISVLIILFTVSFSFAGYRTIINTNDYLKLSDSETVTGQTTFQNNILITGVTTLSTMTLTGACTIYNSLDILNQAGSYLFNVSQSGNVGIGNNNPQSKLNVSGDIVGTTKLGIGATIPTDVESILYGASGQINYIVQSSAGNWISLVADSTDSNYITWDNSSPLVFGTESDIIGAGWSEKARITTGGNLTITGNLFNIAISSTITSATDPGTTGDIRIDANYIYICISTNVWKRAPLATWP